ncbi:class I SAM-dependent methyltransferase [Paenibacillus antri]|uniref:class I SAM-dependent methyltransferase n=1 Tax=Paenibacillus antri TaxID=2582848 RepID=UPI00192E5AA5|nr:class I SAM-dependent methyltransferase [Paenibacillus antri]
MATHEQIYRNEVDAYEFMISKQPGLTKYINEIQPIHGLDILDLGAGSGRFAASLAKQAKSLICTDISESMLNLLDSKLEKQGTHRNWKTLIADHRKLPIEDQSIDIVISGWSICYLTHTGNERWEENLEQIFKEMKRVLRNRGTIIIFETMGTGTEIPKPPEYLKPYFHALTDKYDFKHRWVRADYEFPSFEEAKNGTEFFFGKEVAQRIVHNEWSIVPECAGIWWKHY